QWHAASGDPEAPVEDRHLGRYTGEMLEVTRRHRMRMGFDTLLFWRAIVSVDSVTQQHPEHYDLKSELQDFFMDLRGGPSERVTRVLANGPRGEIVRSLGREGGMTASTIARELFEGTRNAVVTGRESR